MLVLETFVMCIIMVMEALVSGMRTSIASRSAWTGLCETRHGQQQAKPKIRVDFWSLITVFTR